MTTPSFWGFCAGAWAMQLILFVYLQIGIIVYVSINNIDNQKCLVTGILCGRYKMAYLVKKAQQTQKRQINRRQSFAGNADEITE